MHPWYDDMDAMRLDDQLLQRNVAELGPLLCPDLMDRLQRIRVFPSPTCTYTQAPP